MINSVLLVDDDEIFRNAMKSAFEKRKMKVFVAGDEPAAMELFREHSPSLVILDYKMPGLTGISILRQMHVVNPLPVFMLLSGYGSIPMAVESMKEGADSVLQKPCDVDSILVEANKIVEKKKKRVAGMDESEFRSFNLNILERVGIEKALDATKGNVSKAALLLGIDRRTLQRKMKRMF
ncbi:MAG: DNA-binding response regulator [Oligoflexia bacterium]|nr:DNA-binding response regulator [Oligoflexia bacterium]